MYRAVDDPAAGLRSALDELAAYDAVRAEVPRLRGLLGDGDPRVRAAVAYLAGWFPEEAPGSVSALRVLLAAEARPGVAATAVVSAGLLGDTGLIPRLRKGLSGPEPLVRWADAIALARLGDAGAVHTTRPLARGFCQARPLAPTRPRCGSLGTSTNT